MKKINFLIMWFCLLTVVNMELEAQNHQDANYYAYSEWKVKFDRANRKVQRTRQGKKISAVLGAGGSMALLVAEQPDLGLITGIIGGIAYIANSTANTLAKKKLRKLKNEGQINNWVHNPPSPEPQKKNQNRTKEEENVIQKPNLFEIKEKLISLQRLKEDGLITEEEYKKAKEKLINRIQ